MRSVQLVQQQLAGGKPLAIEDFAALDLSRASIFRALKTLLERGEIRRVRRGRYQLASVSDRVSPWMLATRAVPDGVLCLLSALAFHELGTQMPSAVWLALPKSAHRPRLDYPPLQYVHFSGAAFTAGQQQHSVTGGSVRVYSIAKTVADCFKFRNRLGLDVAVEALKGALLEQRTTTVAEIMAMARVCRVQSVIAPYIDTLLVD